MASRCSCGLPRGDDGDCAGRCRAVRESIATARKARRAREDAAAADRFIGLSEAESRAGHQRAVPAHLRPGWTTPFPKRARR
jgi:hypothetical protein